MFLYVSLTFLAFLLGLPKFGHQGPRSRSGPQRDRKDSALSLKTIFLASEAVIWDRLGDHRLGDHLGHQPAGKHDSNPTVPHRGCNWLSMNTDADSIIEI